MRSHQLRNMCLRKALVIVRLNENQQEEMDAVENLQSPLEDTSEISLLESVGDFLERYDLRIGDTDDTIDFYKDFEKVERSEETESKSTIVSVESVEGRKKELSPFWSKTVIFGFNEKWNYFILSTVLLYLLFIVYDFEFVEKTTRFRIFFPMFLDGLYLIDVVLHIIHKEWKALNRTYTYPIYGNWEITFEVLSLIPTDLFIFMAEGINISSRILSYSRINRLLRFIRVEYYYRKMHNRVSNITIFAVMFEWVSHFIVVHQIVVVIFYAERCFQEVCWALHFASSKLSNYEWYVLTLTLLMSPLNNKGFPDLVLIKEVDLIIVTITSIVSYFLVKGYILGYLNSTLIHKRRNTYVYSQYSERTKNYMKFHQIDEKLQQRVFTFYEEMARRRDEFGEINFFEILPLSFVKEVKVDMFWGVFKHTHIFRNMDMAFLQVLALEMTSQFFMPGDIIFKCNGYKRKMVYVISGIIEIISESDEETPIISLSGGTCLGSSSLLLGYRSNTTVKCSTVCQIVILKRTDFLEVLKNYPTLQQEFLKRILDLYAKATELKSLVKILKEHSKEVEEGIGEKDIETSIHWLKVTMKKLMKGEPVYESGQDPFRYVHFTPKNLDLYVMTEELDLITDPICLQSKWPWILQPQSQFLKFWNYSILVISLIAAITLPYYASFICIPMKFKTDPNEIPSCPNANGAVLVQMATVIFYTLDVVVQVLTAVRHEDGLLADWKRVLGYRITCLSFLVDILAAFPFEYIVHFFGKIENVTIVKNVFSLNRLLKMWKWELFAQTLENSLHFNLLLIRMLKFSIYMIFFIYYSGVLLYLVACFKGTCMFNSFMMHMMTNIPLRMQNKSAYYFDPKKNPHMHIWKVIHLAASVFCGNPVLGSISTTMIEGYVILGILFSSAIFFNYMIAVLCATKVLSNKDKDFFKVSLSEIKFLMKRCRLKRISREAIMGALHMKWQYLNGFLTKENVEILPSYSKLRNAVQEDMFFDSLSNCRLFKCFCGSLTQKITSVTEVLVLAPNQTVAIEGQVTKRMYIIMSGYCEVVCLSSKEQEKIVGPGYHFGDVEIFLKLPNANTVQTITHCRFVVIQEPALKRIIALFPVCLQNVNYIVASLANSEELAKFHRKQYTSKLSSKTSSNKKVSIHWFGFHIPWKQSKKEHIHNLTLIILRNFLLPFTFHPDGTFIIWWEIFRIIFAYTTSIFIPARFIIGSLNPDISELITIILDIPAYLDLYVRLHVGYYNSNGILVTHPVKTALYYLKHGFTLDFIACCPWEMVLESQTSKNTYKMTKFIRAFQYHRVHSAITFLEWDINNLHISNYIKVYKSVPIIIFVLSLSAAYLCLNTCTFDIHIPLDPRGIYSQGVRCDNLSWIHKSEVSNTDRTRSLLTPFRVFLFAMYWMTSVMTVCKFKGIEYQTENECIFTTVLMIIGYIVLCFILSTVISTRALKNMDLTVYQEKMHALVKYMSFRKIHPDLHKEVIDYFELKWLKRRAGNVQLKLENFDICLREEVLFQIYGNTLHEYAGIPFIRSMLEYSKLHFVMKSGIVVNANDVLDRTFFLYKGHIDIIAPAGSRLLTLHRGVIFGNLENKTSSRQTLTIEAKSHVEVITVKTAIFYELLNRYPLFLAQFNNIIELNRDFVLPVMSVQEDTKHGGDEESQSQTYSYSQSQSQLSGSFTLRSSKSTIGSVLTMHRAFRSRRYAFKTWDVTMLVGGAYINYMLTLYQAGTQERNIYLMIIQYFIDVLYILKIYWKFHMSYEDENGDIVTDLKLIAKRYFHEKCGLFLDFFTSLPYELTAFAFGNFESQDFLTAFFVFRLNRLGRIAFVVQYFQIHSNKLNINVFWRRSLFLIIVTTLVLHTLTCFILLGFILEGKVYTSLEQDSYMRFSKYLQILDVSVNFCTGGSFHGFIAADTGEIIFSIIICIVMQFISANIIGEMCSVLEVTSFTKTIYAHRIAYIRGYLHVHDLSPALLNQVWQYMVLMWDILRGTQFPSLLAEAPNYLIEGVKTSLFGTLIYSNYVFCTCQVDFLRQLVTKLNQYTFFPGNPIAFQNEINDTMYFIFYGEVEVLIETKDLYKPEIHDILKEGDAFGVIQGLNPRHGHSNSYRARTYSIILQLYRPKWEYLLEFFPDSREEIYDRADTLQFTV